MPAEEKMGTKTTAWDNVLDVVAPPAVAPASIHVGHLVLLQTGEPGEEKRWWMAQVLDRPSNRTTTLEVQPYNTWDKNKSLQDAAFVLTWWDPRAKKEEWRMTAKNKFSERMIMEVDVGHVLLTGLTWRDGRKLPQEVLDLLTGVPPSAGTPRVPPSHQEVKLDQLVPLTPPKRGALEGRPGSDASSLKRTLPPSSAALDLAKRPRRRPQPVLPWTPQEDAARKSTRR